MEHNPQGHSLFGITSPTLRLCVWLIACVTSAACMIVFWPLGVLPFVALIAVAIDAKQHR